MATIDNKTSKIAHPAESSLFENPDFSPTASLPARNKTIIGSFSLKEAVTSISCIHHLDHVSALTEFEELSTISMDDALNKVIEMRNDYLEQKGFKPYQDTDGRWRGYVYQTVDGKRKRKAVSAQTRKEAENKALAYYDGQEQVKRNPKTFAGLREEFFEYRKKKTKTLSTIKRLQTDWDRFFKDTDILDFDLTKLDYDEFEDWFYSRLEQQLYNRKAKKNLPFTSKQAKSMRSLLNQMFHFAIYKGCCQDNYSMMLGQITYNKYCVEYVKADSDRVYQDTKETELIVKAYERLQDDESLANAGVMLDACLDLRVGELTALCFSDFTERPGQLHIQRMEVEVYEEREDKKIVRNGYQIVPHVKTSKSNRYVLVSPAAKNILQLISDYHKAHGITSDYLFVNADGERLHTNAFHNELRRHLNPQIDTSQKSIHAIRRTGLSIIRDALGGKASAQHGGHDEQVNKNHYYYQVETEVDKEKHEEQYKAIDKKMPEFLKN